MSKTSKDKSAAVIEEMGVASIGEPEAVIEDVKGDTPCEPGEQENTLPEAPLDERDVDMEPRFKVTVSLTGAASALNVRESPSPVAKIVGNISHGVEVEVYRETAEYYETEKGYIAKQFTKSL